MECVMISMETSICSIAVGVGWECKRGGCVVGEKCRGRVWAGKY
jgi:hypothetical protein